MSNYYEKQKRSAAAWVLKSLSTNDLWFDENIRKKQHVKNYLYVPLFDIADSSRRYDLNTLKDTCYMLQKNHHLHIWGDDYDSRAMLIQISDEGVQAYKKSFYGRSTFSLMKKGFTAIAAAAAVVAIIISISRFVSFVKHDKYKTTKISQKS